MSTIKTLFITVFVASIAQASAQSFVTIDIEEEYEDLTNQWLTISEDLSHYGGLSAFCSSEEYRTYTMDILNLLHHYDSVVLDLLKNPTLDIDISSKEYRKTMSDIAKFEEEYDLKGFISFLKESCITRRDLEKDKEDLKKEVGMYSYDGQVMMLETDLNKFMHRINKRIVAINDHVHKIHPSQVRSMPVVSSGE
ncbi:MAG: hypothetical protein RLN88_09575 [Ekhidna sp.]|uniref:hypothetical protein n=1 Tax=Ekhidna sp. TaxID=2608089 RepID=UPI0032EE18F5